MQVFPSDGFFLGSRNVWRKASRLRDNHQNTWVMVPCFRRVRLFSDRAALSRDETARRLAGSRVKSLRLRDIPWTHHRFGRSAGA
jgi:hypothetical protein